MNYQFSRDQFGQPVAQFDMGSEAFSDWFTQELAGDLKKVLVVLSAIEQLQNKQVKEFVLDGKEFNLLLDAYEVEVKSKLLNTLGDDEPPEGTEFYDQELMAGCGLEDFSKVLKSWHDFLVDV